MICFIVNNMSNARLTYHTHHCLLIILTLFGSVMFLPSAHADSIVEPEMVAIPGGVFMMGSSQDEKGRYEDEGPQHRVTVRTFEMGKYAVTFAEWDACVADGGCRRTQQSRSNRPSKGYLPKDKGWGRGNRPVIGVNWENAQTYIDWLNKRTGKKYRLPSEAEWEFAARGGTTSQRWWGDAIGKNKANCIDCGSQWGGTQTAPVGSFGANSYGLYDALGNVWQWTEDCWHDNYIGAPSDGSAWVQGSCEERVLRGGSWSDYSWGLRSALRGRLFPDSELDEDTGCDGFRLARSLP